MKSIAFVLVVLSFSQISFSQTLTGEAVKSQDITVQTPSQPKMQPRTQAPTKPAYSQRSVNKAPASQLTPAETLDAAPATPSAAVNSNRSVRRREQGEVGRIGTAYFQRPAQGRAHVMVSPTVQSTIAKATSEGRSVDLNTDALETKIGLGVSDSMTFQARFSYGTDTAKIGGDSFKRTGFSDPMFKLTERQEEENYDLIYGAELGVSPGRAAVVSSANRGDNRYSGGAQITPFIGAEAESIYDFSFGGRTALTLKATRSFDNDTEASGSHVLFVEGFMEREYAPGTLGLLANLTQRFSDNRDQIGTLEAQTALGLGGYGEMYITDQFYVPVRIMYTTGLSRTVDNVDYSRLDTVSLTAGVNYYF